MDIQNSNQNAVNNTPVVTTPVTNNVTPIVQSKPSAELTRISSKGPRQEKQEKADDQQLNNSSQGVAERVLIEAIEKANRKLYGASAEYSFSIHEVTKQIMIKVTDKDTGEVVKEIPSQKALDAVAMMWEFAGLLVDEKR